MLKNKLFNSGSRAIIRDEEIHGIAVSPECTVWLGPNFKLWRVKELKSIGMVVNGGDTLAFPEESHLTIDRGCLWMEPANSAAEFQELEGKKWLHIRKAV